MGNSCELRKDNGIRIAGKKSYGTCAKGLQRDICNAGGRVDNFGILYNYTDENWLRN